jgi:4,5-dihydroxyphthalate decarboxylase
MISARMPSCFVKGSPGVRRLFPDFKKVEMDYFRRTGLFPIMHVIVIRAVVYEEFPWVAQSLYKAFVRSKNLCIEKINDSNVLFTSLPWMLSEYEEVRELMGEDYWPYGFEPNRHALETLQRYLFEQGLIKEKLQMEKLFAPGTLEAFKI